MFDADAIEQLREAIVRQAYRDLVSAETILLQDPESAVARREWDALMDFFMGGTFEGLYDIDPSVLIKAAREEAMRYVS